MDSPTTRLISDADIEPVHQLAERYFQFAYQRPTYLTPEVLRSLQMFPGVDPSVDTILVELDARLLAAALVTASPPYGESSLGLVVEPTLSGALLRQSLRLVTDQFARAVGVRLTTPGSVADPQLVIAVPRAASAVGHELRELGFAPARQVYRMSIDLTAAPAAAPNWPTGVAWRTPTPSEQDIGDAAAVLVEAFADHPGDPFTSEQSAYAMTLPNSRLDLSVLAFDEAGPLGAATALLEPEGGYLNGVGVARRGRGRGIGLALLRQSFAAMRDAEIAVCRLDVEAENKTGAVRLYERAGMHVESVDDLWLRTALAQNRPRP
jgi:ribosomal protein S18 acetylase RimI-like enzyme